MLPLQKGREEILNQDKEPIPDHADPRWTEATNPDAESGMSGRTSNDVDPLKVIIIGAGIGGLTLAQLLMSAPGIRVTCYERSASLDDRLIGFRVMMSGSTLTILKRKLRNEVWAHLALGIGEQPEGGEKVEFLKGNGDKMFTWDSDPTKDQFSVSRWQLREALLHRTEPILRVGNAFDRYELLPKGGARVYLSDGSTDECDLLVGADGWNSMVRKQLNPNATIKDVGVAIIYFKVPLTPKSMGLLGSPSRSMVSLLSHLPFAQA